MSRFRRRRRDDEAAEPAPAPGDDMLDEQDEVHDGRYDDAASRVPAPGGGPSREAGPWDVSEVADPADGGRIDLGGLWIPGAEGLEVRVEADQATGQVIAVTLVLGDGALQLQPFAAPRTEGIWDEVRAEIRAGITTSGGTVDEVAGPVGTELRTKVPVRAQDGSTGVEPARFLGVDGPRWFLRGVITGRPAAEPGADEALLALYRDVVVVRGTEPMAPREPIPLVLPAEVIGDEQGGDEQGGDEQAAAAPESLNPFERGPEITEIR